MSPSIVLVMPTTTVVLAAFMVFMPIMAFVAIRVFPAAFSPIFAVVYTNPLNHSLIMRGCLKGDVPPKNLSKLNGMPRPSAFYIEEMSNSFIVHINTDFCFMR